MIYRSSRNKLIVLVLMLSLGTICKAQDTAKNKKPFTAQGKLYDNFTRQPIGTFAIMKNKDTVYKIVSANSKGGYAFQLTSTDTLKIEADGYVTLKASFKKNPGNIYLVTPLSYSRNKIYTGYASITAARFNGTASSINNVESRGITSGNLLQNLQGKFPGMLVSTGSGNPLSPQTKLVVRGESSLSDSLFSYATQPLIVIDGLIQEYASGVNPLSYIAQQDVANVAVLRDAAGTAMYGARGANGVIVITTKKGFAGKPLVSFTATYGSSEASFGNIKMMSAQQRFDLQREAYSNLLTYSTALTQTKIKDSVAKLIPSSLLSNTNNWQRLAFNRGITQNYDLNITGGSKTIQYFGSFNYLQDKTAATTTLNYQRYTARFNTSFNLKDRVKAEILLSATNEKVNGEDIRGNEIDRHYKPLPWDSIYRRNGTIRLGLNERGWRSVGAVNPLFNKGLNSGAVNNFYAGGQVNFFINVAKGLNLSSSNRLFSSTAEENIFINPKDSSSFFKGSGRVFVNEGSATHFITSNQIKYDKQIGKSLFTVTSGYEYNDVITTRKNTEGKNISSGSTTIFGAQTVTVNADDKIRNTYVSLFGLAEYVFAEKYFVTGSWRRDAISKLRPAVRQNDFYSISGGWLISNENFLRSSKVITHLKLRGSYGTAGNAASNGDYSFYNTWSAPVNNVNNYLNVASLQQQRINNPNLKLEKQSQTNIGFDITLGKRFALSTDWYKKRNTGVPVRFNLPGTAGINSYIGNGAIIENKGLEIGLAYKAIRVKTFSWMLQFNGAYNNNTIVDYKGGVVTSNGITNVKGRPVNSFTVIHFAGIDRNAGIAIWARDSAGRTRNTFETDSATNRFYGSIQPKFVGGFTNIFTYRNFSLTTSFHFSALSQLYNETRQQVEGEGQNIYANNVNLPGGQERWKRVGDFAEMPIAFADSSFAPTTILNSRFLEQNSYLRLANVRIDYTLPSMIVKKLNLRTAEVFFSGDNLLTITGFTGLNPESGSSGKENTLRYPLHRKFLFGIHVSF
jgi:TonB-linked SusC/RagA family outer membrane protein